MSSQLFLSNFIFIFHSMNNLRHFISVLHFKKKSSSVPATFYLSVLTRTRQFVPHKHHLYNACRMLTKTSLFSSSSLSLFIINIPHCGYVMEREEITHSERHVKCTCQLVRSFCPLN